MFTGGELGCQFRLAQCRALYILSSFYFNCDLHMHLLGFYSRFLEGSAVITSQCELGLAYVLFTQCTSFDNQPPASGRD